MTLSQFANLVEISAYMAHRKMSNLDLWPGGREAEEDRKIVEEIAKEKGIFFGDSSRETVIQLIKTIAESVGKSADEARFVSISKLFCESWTSFHEARKRKDSPSEEDVHPGTRHSDLIHDPVSTVAFLNRGGMI